MLTRCFYRSYSTVDWTVSVMHFMLVFFFETVDDIVTVGWGFQSTSQLLTISFPHIFIPSLRHLVEVKRWD